MPKKTTILIVILAVITGILIFLAVRSDQSQLLTGKNKPNPAPTVAKVQPYASLSFSLPVLDLTAKAAYQTIGITIDTGNKPVTGVQVELSYDPKVFTNVSIAQPIQNPFFGKNAMVLIKNVDATQGRVSYAVGISPQETEKIGIGTIATLSFTANKFAGVSTSQITFLPKSQVTTLSATTSVLRNAESLQVILTAPTDKATQGNTIQTPSTNTTKTP